MFTTVRRWDFDPDWVPSADLLAFSLSEVPVLGPDAAGLTGADTIERAAILMLRPRDLGGADRHDIGPIGDEWYPIAYVADVGQAAAFSRPQLRSGDICRITEGMALIGGSAHEVQRWGVETLGGFLTQIRVFRVEIDPVRKRAEGDLSDLAGIAVEMDGTAGRDLIGEDIARWSDAAVKDQRRPKYV